MFDGAGAPSAKLSQEREHPRAPGHKQYKLYTDLSRNDFVTELQMDITQTAEATQSDVEALNRLVQTVLSNGDGLQARWGV